MHSTTWAPNTMWSSRKNYRVNSKKTSEQKDGKTFYSYDPGHGQESYKRISQLNDIAVENKNKIRYNSAQHTSLT